MWGYRSFEPRTSYASSCLTRCFAHFACLAFPARRSQPTHHEPTVMRACLSCPDTSSTREPRLPVAVARGDSPRSVVEVFFSRMETETRLHIGFLPRQAHVGSTKYSRCDFIGLIRHITCCSRACTALTVIRLQALEVFRVSDGNDWANHS